MISIARGEWAEQERRAIPRVVTFATLAWCGLFGAPHVWWLLGWPYGFPGGRASYDLFMSAAWRIAYGWFVVGCCVLGVFVALTLSRAEGSLGRRRLAMVLGWIAFVLLSLRGVAGLIVDRFHDLIWDPTFALGGALFGALIWHARRAAPSNLSRSSAI